MKPCEIVQHKQQSSALQQALKEHREVWAFLRNKVKTFYGPLIREQDRMCERCSNYMYPSLTSPYNNPYPGWCIDCVLHDFLANDKTLEEIEQERQDEEACRMWGPPEGYGGLWA